MYKIPVLPIKQNLDTIPILKQVNKSNQKLAELKGIALTIPNENILINTLILQEAKDSSAIENIITTNDELYKAEVDLKNFAISSSTKEVIYYADSLKHGFDSIRKNKVLSLSMIKDIQATLVSNNAGFRSVAGTNLQNQNKDIVYIPPQSKDEIEKYMTNLEIFINDDSISNIDPLIKMAIIHHQFESIHPFYDGNGRTGRIINVLYLVMKNLLDLPILYLSRYIIENKSEYYKLLQDVRDNGSWENWIIFILKAVEQTASQTIILVKEIGKMMQEYKMRMRPLMGTKYSHELLNNLFYHPYTKIEFVEEELKVSRLTATTYLNILAENNFVTKTKIGRSNYYLNTELINLLTNRNIKDTEVKDTIESITNIF
jgi:Fic family protein